MGGKPHPAPEGQTWLLVDVRAENASEQSRTLPWRQGFWVRLCEDRIQHDVNDVPSGVLFWDGGDDGGDPVDPDVVEEGVVPIPADADAAERLRAVIYGPIAVDVDTEIWVDG